MKVAEGCLGGVDWIDRAWSDDVDDVDDGVLRKLRERRRELLGTACVLMPRSRAMREYRVGRVLGTIVGLGPSPTQKACLRLALSWLGENQNHSRQAFEFACAGHEAPAGCMTQMKEWRIFGEALVHTCKPQSHGKLSPEALTACEDLSRLIDPARARTLRKRVCSDRGRDALACGKTPIRPHPLQRAMKPLITP
jgi:hypothetical protein